MNRYPAGYKCYELKRTVCAIGKTSISKQQSKALGQGYTIYQDTHVMRLYKSITVCIILVLDFAYLVPKQR